MPEREFPVDDVTLGMLHTALHPDSEAERTSVADLLDMLAAGPDDGEPLSWHPNDVISALLAEVRRQRPVVDAARAFRRAGTDTVMATLDQLAVAVEALDRDRADGY